MGFGRLIRVTTQRGDPDATVYVVAEPDPAKAMDIIKFGIAGPNTDLEDLGRVTDELLKALALEPGRFSRT
jgi:hypothetical protein